MFITSRESPINPFAFSTKLIPAPVPPARGLLLRETASPSIACPRAFGVPSISQPRKTPARSESPRFLGFFAHFLELGNWCARRRIYILWCLVLQILLEVFRARTMTGHVLSGN